MPDSYTPGPWFNDGKDIMAEDNLCVATVHRPRMDDEGTRMPNGQANANARLIAAAPELLAACRVLMEYWQYGTPVDGGSEAADQVRSAIAKAEGRVVIYFRQLFADPDDICESEYRAIYTTLKEVLPDAPEHEREGMCRGILESYVRSATEMLATLNRHAKAEGSE